MNRRVFVSGIAAGLVSAPSTEAVAKTADVSDFTKGAFQGVGQNRWTYYRSGTGPPVMVLHELFGWSPLNIEFTRRLRDRGGFTVYAPILFGAPGHAETLPYQAQCSLHVCTSREFKVFERNQSSPICDDLRMLGKQMFAEHGPPGFGVIGLCLTGNFALAMMADEALIAPVVAGPSLPFDWSKDGRKALHLSKKDRDNVRQRIASGTKILGYRFSADTISPPERFAAMREEFSEGFEGHEIDSTPKGHHSVFVEHYDESTPSTRDAFIRLVEFLKQRLHRGGASTAS